MPLSLLDIWRLLLLIILCAVIVFATAAYIVVDGIKDNVQKCDVAIILGSKVNLNGTPSPRLAARLDKGIELYQQGYFHHVIVSGGAGKEGYDESAVMKNYLIEHRIPASAIIADNQGNNTQSTAKNSQNIMRQSGYKSAMVISQYFHIARSTLALSSQSITPVYHAHANFYEWRDLYSIPREVAAYYRYILSAR